jgi:hypothetical protein
MRRALSLLALGITLALTAAQPTMTLTSIKVVDMARTNKDQWRLKGYLDDPDGNITSAIDEVGTTATLQNSNDVVINTVAFDPAGCKLLNKDKGIICKAMGARMSLKRTKRVPKDVMITPHGAHNKTNPNPYYKILGVFRRQEFNVTVSTPLTAAFAIAGVGEFSATNTKCTEKDRKRTSKYLCMTGAPSPGNWTQQTAAGSRNWFSIASSSDGSVRVGMQAIT